MTREKRDRPEDDRLKDQAAENSASDEQPGSSVSSDSGEVARGEQSDELARGEQSPGADRLQGFAFCNWLIDGQHDARTLKRAAHWAGVWFEEQPKLARKEIQFGLNEFLEAAQYEMIVQRFEQAGAKKPTSLRQIQGQGTMCYVIARQRLGLENTAKEVDEAIDTFLKRRIPQWLGGDGNWTGAARWMKLAFWKKGDDPIATVLRCYDYLPGLKPPKYP